LAAAVFSLPSPLFFQEMIMTYQEFERECNRVLTNMAGLGIHDLADATWRDYYDDGMTPRSAIECANDDFWDGELNDILHG
tara:strand:+ start:1228 stop:1470 length:243 start_codon:yes stop_codon:yes gene_type:complete